jgi:hypothetical protein
MSAFGYSNLGRTVLEDDHISEQQISMNLYLLLQNYLQQIRATWGSFDFLLCGMYVTDVVKSTDI